MRHITSVFILVVVVVAAWANKPLSRRQQWNLAQQPFHVIGNIYFVGTAGLGSYLITSPQGHILLDGALPESAPQIEKHVAALGFRMQDVKYLVNSHAHYDHAGSLAELKRVTGARMVASRGDASTLNSGFQSSYGAGWDSHFPAVKVDRIVEDGGTVQAGDVTLTAVLTPGHTRGCTTWTMPVAENGKTYRAVFYCSTSVPGYHLVDNKYYPEMISDYERSFAILQNLPCDVFLANHAEFFRMREKLARQKSGAANPFVDPAEMHRFVSESKAQFEQELQSEQNTQPSR
jgi:metallo-beta-lactamase class B